MDITSPSERPRRERVRLVGIVLASVVAATAVTSGYWRMHDARAAGQPAAVQAHVAVPAGFADLIKKVSPAVVRITISGVVKTGADVPPELKGTPFEQFFQQFGGQERSQRVRGLGSGFIIDPSGYIVTNDHVAGKAQSVKVTLADGREFTAKVVGDDPKTDLALVKIESDQPLPFVSFGNSSEAQVGNWVVALGNPFGLGGTATAGIVSARGRDLGSGPYDDFIQTDASINPGNSGGPLFDASGQVVGVNSVIYTPNGGNVGIGFAISSDLASKVVDELKAHGHIDRGWLGVSMQRITPELAQGLGLKDSKGALITEVEPNSPAAKAGLSVGDVVVGFRGQTINGPHDLAGLAADTASGTSVTVRVVRGGQTKDVQAQIGKVQQTADARDATEAQASPAVLGMSFVPLDQDVRRELGIGQDVRGVVVAAVDQTGVAADHGIQPGDVIVAVDRKPVSSPADARKAFRQAQTAHRGVAVLQVMRDSNILFIALPPQV
jgi:serine protease Do